MTKRKVDIVVISDVHLGTYGCQAKELLHYLKSIEPGMVILNGDIIDMWQFSKRYFPESHLKVLRRILKYISQGIPVHYLTGNHDEVLRKFDGFELGSLKISNKLVLDLDGKKAWIFHGDVFDITMQYSKVLAKLGAVGYDTLILLNTFINFILKKFGKEKMSLSKKIKQSVKNAVKFINDFEDTAAEIAIEKEYDYVICGHIHHAEKKIIKKDNAEVMYLNSGDWVESLTSLEYHNGQWDIHYFKDFSYVSSDEEELKEELLDLQQQMNIGFLYQSLIEKNLD
jgi:UDP-2,3-diacylglucosamine pyrophosphatase LpxH